MLRSICSFFIALVLLAGTASAQDWSGNWESSYGQLRLSQDGARVWGDYAERGVIEARVSADNTRMRGVFVYTDGRWGILEFRRNGPGTFEGNWSWGVEILTASRSWTATRETETSAALRYASEAPGWPDAATGHEQAMIRQFAFFEGQGGTLPAIPWEPNPYADPERSELGFWYGSYELAGLGDFATITLDVDHLMGGDTALVNMQMQVLGQSECPAAMHVALCADVLALQGQGTVVLEVEGVTFATAGPKAGSIAFRLPGKPEIHILRIEHGGGPGSFFARLIHPRRGLDFEGYLTRLDHVCDIAQCQGGRFAPLIISPDEWRGVFDRAGFVGGYDFDLDGRDAARHQGAPGDGVAAGDPQVGADWLSETWAIHDETSLPIGVIEFARDAGGSLLASGEMDPGTFVGAVAETQYLVRREAETGFDIAVLLFADGSSEQALGRMTLAHPGFAPGNPDGVLTIGDLVIDVTLVPVGDGDWRAADMPGFGVYAVTFGLHNVPEGKDLVLRAAPDVASPITGQVARDVTGLWVKACQPDVDNISFETGGLQQKTDILAATWCQVDAGPRGTGWVKGVFLLPEG